MIDKHEILEFAREFSLAPDVIEKDYVLGWLLAGISADPEIGTSWIFKGGTCLKKCYFETYRFSEDLDFTLTDASHVHGEFLQRTFIRIAEWIYERTGIVIPADTLRFDLYENPRGNPSIQGRVEYRGPMGRQGSLPRVKLDLTDDEVLVLEPVVRRVHHPYSDRSDDVMHVTCYAFEEVFAEKVRALAERGRPRDLYDVIHLFRHDELQPDRRIVMHTLDQKCKFKSIPVPTHDSINQEKYVELQSDWSAMLEHQLPSLPPFDQFWNELPAFFEWLHNDVMRVGRPTISISSAEASTWDVTWQPPAMVQAWNESIPMELIRFAAANRLCVDLLYNGDRRLIEPYSLRRTRDGNLLLYAVKRQSGELRSYRVDRIQGATVTQTEFTPRFVIELTPVGPQSAPPSRRATGASPKAHLHLPRARKPQVPFSTKYVYECPLCHKKFTRSSFNSSLNEHKDKNGYSCPGRTGILVEIK